MHLYQEWSTSARRVRLKVRRNRLRALRLGACILFFFALWLPEAGEAASSSGNRGNLTCRIISSRLEKRDINLLEDWTSEELPRKTALFSSWIETHLSRLEILYQRRMAKKLRLSVGYLVRSDLLLRLEELSEQTRSIEGQLFEVKGRSAGFTDLIERVGLLPEEALRVMPERYAEPKWNLLLHAIAQLHSTIILGNSSEGREKSFPERKKRFLDAAGRAIDRYFGDPITEFQYQGKSYSPKSFAEAVQGEAEVGDRSIRILVPEHKKRPFIRYGIGLVEPETGLSAGAAIIYLNMELIESNLISRLESGEPIPAEFEFFDKFGPLNRGIGALKAV